MTQVKKLSTGKVWCFAVGQFGWSALISSWLVNYYQPDLATQRAGQPIFIPQGLAILGVLTVLGAITAFGRLFDAVTDPLIASLSDRCKSKDGRRIPFMRAAAVPFALSCILTFWSPVNGESWLNAAFLFVMLMVFTAVFAAYAQEEVRLRDAHVEAAATQRRRVRAGDDGHDVALGRRRPGGEGILGVHHAHQVLGPRPEGDDAAVRRHAVEVVGDGPDGLKIWCHWAQNLQD